ncbi:MAG: BMP family ABC transporter substrate-binding protein [Lachnospiraceae bacterium]|nr:BMP family ABC transporter substrate-binding protein [Lachnospiraceae bacterium]
MKKKLLALLTVAAMTLSLAACGASGGAGGASGGASSAPAEGGAAEGASDFSVCIITDVGGVNDKSFNQSAWEGAQRAASELGVTANYLESKTDADYMPNIETAIDEGYDLIICVGYMLAAATKEAAEAHPDQQFAIIDDSSNADLANVTCLMFEQSQCSYLVGYIAGLTTQSDTVGFVLGMASDAMHEFGYGYVAGVLDANPEATVLQANANNFGDSAGGKALANQMIAQGADVIYHAAGGTGLGVIEACQEAGIWAIGVDSDQSNIAPGTILSSAMKRVDTSVFDITKMSLEGSFPGGVRTYSLADDGVGIAPTTDNIAADVLTQVESVRSDIIAGSVSVPKNKADFEAAHGEAYELDD